MAATRAFRTPRVHCRNVPARLSAQPRLLLLARRSDGVALAAAAYLITEKSFRKIQGYQDLWMLQALLDETQTAVQQQVA